MGNVTLAYGGEDWFFGKGSFYVLLDRSVVVDGLMFWSTAEARRYAKANGHTITKEDLERDENDDD